MQKNSSKTTEKQQGIGLWQGAALLATTLLGTGVFILPQLSIQFAGASALPAWLLLTLLSVPITIVFAKLASVLPHAAGPAHFVAEAFGSLAGRLTGLLFMLVVPLGASAAMMMTFSFIAPWLGTQAALPVELGLLLLLWLLNRRGFQLSARLQLALTLAIVAVVLLMLAGFVYFTPSSAQPLQMWPQQTQLAGFSAALAIGFWSFLGVEAMTHLAQDFRDPKRHLLPALLLGLLLVGLIYLGCSYLLLVLAAPGENLSMAQGFDRLFGSGGILLIGVLGLCSGLATVNVYTASVARLCQSFSAAGVLPALLAPLNRYQMPQRALSFMLSLMAMVLLGSAWFGAGLEDLIGWVNGVFVLIYLASMAAALRLLSRRYQPLAWISLVVCAAVAWILGMAMLYALLIVLLGWPLLYWQQQWQQRRLQAEIPQ
jgi:amino acid efflux transporter